MKISNIKFNKKPSKKQMAIVVNDILKQKDIDPDLSELATAIENGQTLILDNFKGDSNKKGNFISTMYIGIDIDDEEYLKKDNAFELTGELLKAHGIEWYIRYKTFSYSDECPRHRYILKSTKPLTLEQTNSIYQAVGVILPVDKQTTYVCRTWLGTHYKLMATDMPGLEIDFDNLDLSNIKKPKALDTIKSMTLTQKLELQDVNFKCFDYLAYKNEIIKMHKNWEHGDVFKGLFQVALIMIAYGNDTRPRDIFLDNLPTTSNKTREERKNSYIQQFNTSQTIYNYKQAFELIKKLTSNRFNDYNMFKGLKKTNLNEREEPFINADDIAQMKGMSLLVAPAGSGKTTAIINYALNVSKKHIVLVVPLVPIIQKLEATYGQYDKIEYLYSQIGQVNRSKIKEKSTLKLTICTTESYYREKCSDNGKFKYLIHQVFIDEAHEVVSFFGIDGLTPRTNTNNFKEKKGEITKKVLNNLPDNATFVTATPFNLANVFTQRKVFVKNTDKKVNFIKTRGSKATIIDILKLDKYQSKKTLVYVNSKTKMIKLEKEIRKKNPKIKVCCIYSGSLKKNSDSLTDYTNIMNKKPIESDVIITTKYLNVGVDINGVFNLVIYADTKLDINSCLQLFNRERQKCDFIVLHSAQNDEKDVFININNKIKDEEIAILIDDDIGDSVKHLLLHFLVYDDKKKRSIISQHIAVDQLKYKKMTTYMNIHVLKDLFKWFYPNITFTDNDSVKDFENDKKKPITQQMRAKSYKLILKCDLSLSEIMDITIKNILINSKIDKISRFEYKCIAYLLEKTTDLKVIPYITEITQLKNIEEHPIFKRRLSTAVKMVSKRTPSYDILDIRNTINELNNVDVFYIGDSVNVKPYEKAPKIKYCLNKLKKTKTLTKQDKEKMCEYFNENNFNENNVKWTSANFIHRAERFGYYYEDQLKKINGKVIRVCVNKTVYLD